LISFDRLESKLATISSTADRSGQSKSGSVSQLFPWPIEWISFLINKQLSGSVHQVQAVHVYSRPLHRSIAQRPFPSRFLLARAIAQRVHALDVFLQYPDRILLKKKKNRQKKAALARAIAKGQSTSVFERLPLALVCLDAHLLAPVLKQKGNRSLLIRLAQKYAAPCPCLVWHYVVRFV
jgi:hypothetical protein